MRCFVLLLMVLLLPLRGWVGDAMATGTLAAPLHAVHMAKAAAISDTHSLVSPPKKACAGCSTSKCSTCQLCHAMALQVESASALSISPRLSAPGFVALAFASTAPPARFKPPIS